MVTLIAIVIGLIAGASVSDAGGAIVGGLLAWLTVRSMRQQNEIDALQKTALADAVRRSEAAPATTPLHSPINLPMPGALLHLEHMPAPEPADDAAALEGFSDAQREAFARAGPDTLPFAAGAETSGTAAAMAAEASASPTTETAAVASSTPRPPGPDPLGAIKRWFFGGNTIVKVGVGILFVGLAFLAKLVTEHTSVPVEVRLAAIGAAAIALLVFGWRLRTRRPDYAQVLQGGAVAVLYLTLFAAFRYYGVLAATPAFVLMVAVAAFAAALAVLQNARALAVVGALGGFATPLIVSTGSDNYVALFAYYFVLDAGIAAVAWFKTWRPLNLVGFAATFLVATAWGVLEYSPAEFATSEAFLIAFFLLFVVILVLPSRRARAEAAAGIAAPQRDAWVNSSLLFGLPTVTFALQYGLVAGTPFATAFSAFALGGFYVALAFWMRKRPELGVTFEASLAIAIVLLTLVIPFALDERSTAGAWTLEAAGLVWIGLRQRRLLPRLFGYLLLIGAGISMLAGHDRYGAPTVLFNAYLFNGLMAAAASLAAAFFVQRQRGSGALRQGEGAVQPLLVVLGTLWLMSTAALEVITFVPGDFMLAATVVAASAVAALYALLSARLQWPQIAWPTLVHAPILFLAAAIDAAFVDDPALAGGWWAWPLAFAAHGLVLRFAAPRWPQFLAHAIHALGAITMALLGALLGRALTAGLGDSASAWPWLGWLIVPALLLLLLPRPATARVWPVRALPAAYRVSAAAVLAAGLGVWTLVANIASDGSAAPLPHVPFLNPLDIGIGIALAAIYLWLRSAGPGRADSPWAIGLAAAAGFVWLNAILVRGFHHYGGVPYEFEAWLGSLAVQTGITLLWTAMALAAMWVGAKRAWRTPWMAGAVLLGVVVAKLMLVDLSGSVTRIVSFIGVGVLMLVIGYVAPLPAKELRHAAV